MKKVFLQHFHLWNTFEETVLDPIQLVLRQISVKIKQKEFNLITTQCAVIAKIEQAQDSKYNLFGSQSLRKKKYIT